MGLPQPVVDNAAKRFDQVTDQRFTVIEKSMVDAAIKVESIHCKQTFHEIEQVRIADIQQKVGNIFPAPWSPPLPVEVFEIDFEKQFDGIWACASLLHVSEKELDNIFVEFWRALKDNGILYASWKYGEEERYDGERFYCDMTEEKLKNVLARVNAKVCLPDANMCSETHDCEGDANLFECLDCWVAEDALPSGREQKWLNVVLRKSY